MNSGFDKPRLGRNQERIFSRTFLVWRPPEDIYKFSEFSLVTVQTYYIHQASKKTERKHRQHDVGSLWTCLPRRWPGGIHHVDDRDVLDLLDLREFVLLLQLNIEG